MELSIVDGDARITQLFGEHPADYAMFGLLGHNGVDLAVPIGTPLKAPEDASLVEAAFDAAGYGWYVKLRTAAGADWLFGHMDGPSPLEIGQAVAAGEGLGESGNSGNSTGPHVHVGYRPDDAYRGGGYAGYVDPLPYLIDATGGS
jgi:murein DD-endopeptidase MepM/ murein hydrolase activator NlpD